MTIFIRPYRTGGQTLVRRLEALFHDLTAGGSRGPIVSCEPGALGVRMGTGRIFFTSRQADGGESPQGETNARIGQDAGDPATPTSRDTLESSELERELRQIREEISHLSRVALAHELSGSLAHELTQPLGAILINAQALRRLLAVNDPDLEEVRAVVQEIIADDERASEVILRLRQLLRRADGDGAGVESIDLADLVRQVLVLVRGELKERGVTLQADLDAAVGTVRGDRVQLQQVILNLLMNAIDAMAGLERGHRVLEVRIEPQSRACARISVSDSGPGVAPELQERLFDAFVTTKATGLGMGLAICRTIVAAHGGAIEARNRDGGGATFSFTLPTTSPG